MAEKEQEKPQRKCTTKTVVKKHNKLFLHGCDISNEVTPKSSLLGVVSRPFNKELRVFGLLPESSTDPNEADCP